MNTLFGTDGYRGTVDYSAETGINPRTFELLSYEYMNLVAEQTGQSPLVIVGSDTRESGSILREAAINGASSAGAEVWDLGIAPTPVIAWLAKKYMANAVAITASHNPAGDNGFKPFDIGGDKPTTETLSELESRYFKLNQRKLSSMPRSGKKQNRTDLKFEYLEQTVDLLSTIGTLEGKTVIVDGANGAAFELAPLLYKKLGANVIKFACHNDGLKINKGVGAAHLDGLVDFIVANKEDLGSSFIGAFANDGDADRVMGVDRNGNIVNGNHWMAELAQDQKGIVGTVYTNSATRKKIKEMGVEFYECPNGDSNVTAKLKELTLRLGEGFKRGGEFTGHLIDMDHIPSGDGLLMGAWLAIKAAQENANLSDVYNNLHLWPERMVSLKVNGTDSRIIVDTPSVQDAITKEKDFLGEAGRVIVRASGTEPIIRVWAEAQDVDMLEASTVRLAEAIQAV